MSKRKRSALTPDLIAQALHQHLLDFQHSAGEEIDATINELSLIETRLRVEESDDHERRSALVTATGSLRVLKGVLDKDWFEAVEKDGLINARDIDDLTRVREALREEVAKPFEAIMEEFDPDFAQRTAEVVDKIAHGLTPINSKIAAVNIAPALAYLAAGRTGMAAFYFGLVCLNLGFSFAAASTKKNPETHLLEGLAKRLDTRYDMLVDTIDRFSIEQLAEEVAALGTLRNSLDSLLDNPTGRAASSYEDGELSPDAKPKRGGRS